MNMSRIGSSVLLAAWLAAGAAYAQSTPDPLQPGAAAQTPAAEAMPGPKMAAIRRVPRKVSVAAGLTVTISNKRSVGLVELQVGPTGGELKKVQGPLAFGRKSIVRIPRVKDCLYDIKGHFADEADTDLTGVDLCKDKAINLTDE